MARQKCNVRSLPSGSPRGSQRCLQMQCLSSAEAHPSLRNDSVSTVLAKGTQSTHLAMHGVSVPEVPDVRRSAGDARHVQSSRGRRHVVLHVPSISTLLRVSHHAEAGDCQAQQDEIQRMGLLRLQTGSDERTAGLVAEYSLSVSTTIDCSVDGGCLSGRQRYAKDQCQPV